MLAVLRFTLSKDLRHIVSGILLRMLASATELSIRARAPDGKLSPLSYGSWITLRSADPEVLVLILVIAAR